MREALAGFCLNFYSTAFELARRPAGPMLASVGRSKGWNLDERQKMPRPMEKFHPLCNNF